MASDRDDDSAEVPRPATDTTGSGADTPTGYRMALPEAAVEERRHREQVSLELVRHYRKWVSSVFLLATVTLLLWAAFVAALLLNLDARLGLLLALSFLPGTLATWGASMWAAWRTRDRRWLLFFALSPIVPVLISGFLPLWMAIVIIPPIPCWMALVWAWSKRDAVAGIVDGS
jgi:hypothetical protein